MTDGSSGAVKLVLGVEDEKNLDGLDDLGVGSVVGITGVSIHHVEEVLNVAKVLLGRDDRLADTVTVAGSGDSWGAADNTVDVLVSLLTGLVDVSSNVGWVGLGVEGGHGGHKSGHHSHGVSVVTESLDERFETVMISGVLHDLLGERTKLLVSGELTVDEKEGSLEEGGGVSELLNGVTTVLKDTLLTVNPGNARDAGDGVHVGGIVGASHLAGGALDLGNISSVDGTILDGELVALASTVIHNGEGVLGELVGSGGRAELRVDLVKTLHYLFKI